MTSTRTETATFAAGCFWCLDSIMRIVKGVTKVSSGYSGGEEENPTYESIHTNHTGHAESVQVMFDPEAVSYETLLEIFWSSHNPTTPNQDGANVGEEYRSIIFYHNDKQRRLAEWSKENIATKLWDDPIVTEIVPARTFYDAEEYHQRFYYEKPTNPYCQIVINPKLDKFKKRYQAYLRDEPL